MRAGRSGVRRGFTLLEALIALVIVGVAATVSMEAFAAGLRGELQASRHLEAVALAEARLNELALVPLDSVPRYAEPRDSSLAPPFERYRVRAAMRAVPGAPSLVDATVTVHWPGGSYALATVFYRPRRGPNAAPAGAAP